ncbi:MAG: ATP-binding protein, partial [Streptosporangiaceae bacterium]
RARLTTGLLAPSQAREVVRTAVRSWPVSVDEDIAVLLTSDLVTSAIRHAAGDNITLGVSATDRRLRVDLLGTALADAPLDEETGRGLVLVARLSDTWGFYRTPAGKAVYFTLAFDEPPFE